MIYIINDSLLIFKLCRLINILPPMDAELEQKLSFIKQDPVSNTNNPQELLSKLNQTLQSNKPLNSIQFERLFKSNNIPVDEEGGLFIEPDKGFCIKTHNNINNEKIFINITSHAAVEKPEETEILQDNNPSAGFRVPMSVLPPITHHAKEIGLIIDACVNPFIIDKLRSESFKGETIILFINILFNYLYQKFQIECTQKYKILKNCRYKGSYIQHHRIRYKKAPKIKILDEENDLKAQNLDDIVAEDSRGIKPDFDIALLFEDGQEEIFDGINWDEDVLGLGFIFKMPMLTTGKFIDVLANDEEIEIKNKIYETVIRMPRRMQIDTYKVVFNDETREMRITGQFIDNIEEQTQEKREPALPKKNIELKSNLIDDIM